MDCESEDDYHVEHENEEHYYDVPRLLVDANRKSALEGRHRLSSPEWLLEDHPAISLIICNIYDCVGYHESIADDFERLWMPLSISEDVVRLVRPYFSILREDAKLAQREERVLIPSKGLRRAMNVLESFYPDQLRNWDEENNLTYPYLQLWHCKDLFRAPASRMLEPAQQLHVDALLSYLEDDVAAEWEESEQIFSNGLVNKQHWAKLFRPNDPIITMKDGEPRAYVSRNCPTIEDEKLLLNCWSWEFDGEFYLEDSTFEVGWPSRSDAVPISDLAYFPLRCDKTDLTRRLERRGHTFWSCRKRRYVSYDKPSEGASVQSVRSLTFTLPGIRH